MKVGTRWATAVAGVTVAALVLAGCGKKIEQTEAPASASAVPCDPFTIAVNPWVGYEANAAVVQYVAKTKLGCTVTLKELTEEVSWQGFANGQVDVILENWGHNDLKQKYIEQQKVAVESGLTGNKGIIGWYVPPWLAKEYPDVLDYKNLNKYADKFATSESGGKGQLLDGDPSYVTNDEALVKNLGLNFKVVYAGSEDALIAAFKKAEEQKQWLIGYFYEPQWFLSDVALAHVNLPPYTPGCDADPKKVACDYQPYDLDKIVSKKFADSNSPAVNLIKNFQWTNDDQNSVAIDISKKVSYEDAAKKWVDANADKVAAWLK
ncbi:ABC transporter substrate-binding protein [Luedemannella helvata]|uniref:ABC transporter substrate-binding protein n=1 Tax=Luedemannella helvata TaxID=349315 RepID=A0ABP4WP46_9ACTN